MIMHLITNMHYTTGKVHLPQRVYHSTHWKAVKVPVVPECALDAGTEPDALQYQHSAIRSVSPAIVAWDDPQGG